MKQNRDTDDVIGRKSRLVAVVIAATMVVWIAGQWLASTLGLAVRFRVLLDLAALAGFFWSIVVIYQIWRARQEQ